MGRSCCCSAERGRGGTSEGAVRSDEGSDQWSEESDSQWTSKAEPMGLADRLDVLSERGVKDDPGPLEDGWRRHNQGEQD